MTKELKMNYYYHNSTDYVACNNVFIILNALDLKFSLSHLFQQSDSLNEPAFSWYLMSQGRHFLCVFARTRLCA